MKTLFSILGIAVFLISFNQASAQCGAQMVAPSPQAIGVCEGIEDTVTFSPTGNCTGNYEYQIETSNNVVIQPWTTNNQYIFTPDSTDRYNVLARCSTCPGTVVSDTFLVEVVEDPAIMADTISCYGAALSLSGVADTSVSLSWWSTPDNSGSQLSATSSYTTPPLMANDTFYLHANGTLIGGGTSGSVLITEAGTGGFPGSNQADYLEVANLFGSAINTTGWVVAISDSYNNINSVNNTLWNLPSSFSPCSIVSKTDVAGQNNYWGSNMFWNPGNPGWAIILDDQGNIVDFVAWGYSTAQLATFNVNINGYNVTLGTEWQGNSVPAACGANGAAVPFSISRIGNADNNNASDFICQATSLNQVNPTLNCGWTLTNITCPHIATVEIDMPPTGSAPDTIFVDCYAAVPAPDSLIIDDEADDYGNPTVQYMGEVSNGTTCPEILTRTYRVQDSCSNFIDLEHIIVINDTVPPIIDPAPQDLTVSCYSDIPPIDTLNWTDNCDGNGVVNGTEVSDGQTCPETFTRTWSYIDGCGNAATQTQTIVVNDITPPTADQLPSLQLAELPPADTNILSNVYDNCGTPIREWIGDNSDGGVCPENLVRTYSLTDACGNITFLTQQITVGDNRPNVSFTADPTLLDNLSDGVVEFDNNTTGAATYTWDFGDFSELSNATNPSHQYDITATATFDVWLVATSEFNCSDSIMLSIDVFQELVYFVPNAFTPDGDQFNQIFNPVFAAGFDPQDYSLVVYNRWGEILFESNDDTVGWDGTYGGKLLNQGTYLYKIEFGLENSDARKIVTGHVTLLR